MSTEHDNSGIPPAVQESALDEFPMDEAGGAECRQILQDWFARLDRYQLWEAVSDLKDIQNALWQNDWSFEDSKRDYTPGTLWAWPGEETLQRPPRSWAGDRSPASLDSLDQALTSYLQRPWLQHNRIDVSAINALLFTELAIAVEDIRTGAAFGVPKLSYIFSGGNLFAQFGLAIAGRIVGFLLKWVTLPAIALALLAYSNERGALIVIGIWGLYVLYRIVMIPARWKLSSARRVAEKKANEIIEAMLKAWHASRHSTISPSRLKELVVAAETRGTLYRPVLHTLLDRAIQRDSAALVRC